MSGRSGLERGIGWSGLAQAMEGAVLLPGQPGYEDRRRVWNGAIDRHPLAIAQCVGPGDVEAAIRFAAGGHIRMTVRGGGHNVAGTAVRDDAMMVDLGRMNRVEVDRASRIVHVEGGALWREVDAATQPFGLATTGGLISSTGIGGYTLGGGVGWLMRRCGLAIDNLVEASLVLADGRSVIADEGNHADLFWALRGGAGGFGVVTRFTYRLHDVAEVYAGLVFHPLEAAGGLLRAFRDFTPDAPRPLTAMLVFTTVPPLPFLPVEAHHRRAIALAWCWSGEPGEGMKALAPLTEHGHSWGRHAGVMPYSAWQQALDPTAPSGDHYYWSTSQFDALDDAMIESLIAIAAGPPDPLCEVHVHHLGGAVAAVANDTTAFSHRDAPFFVNMIGHAGSKERFPAVREWVRGSQATVAARARVGIQPNFTSDLSQLKGHPHNARTIARLQALRERYDPEGLLAPVREARSPS